MQILRRESAVLMINGKKLFALCTSRIHNDEVLESVKYFLNEAKKRGHAVIVFNSSLEDANIGPIDAGCYSVYDLIPFSKVDAVVLMSETIDDRHVSEAICHAAKLHGIPVLAYDAKYSECPSVYSYSTQAFSSLLAHIFDVHGCKRVDLITGIRGHYGSECMVFAYQEALHQRGLPFEEQRLEYGNYWAEPTYTATERLLAYDTPEAIVCVNDDMAIACCSMLRQRGFNVPEDIIVTGCDGILKERTHMPRLTTCKKDLYHMASAFFDTAELLLDGGTVDMECEVPPILQISESCGCHPVEQIDQNNVIEYYHNRLRATIIQESNEHRIFGTLMERPQSTILDYLDVLASHIPSEAYLCLRDCLSPDTSPTALGHFAAENELMSTVRLKRKEKRYAIVQREHLMPDLEEMLSRDFVPILNSIYLQQEIYGYYVYYGSDLDEECFKLPKFIHTAGNVIGACLNAARLKAANEKLLSARIRDPLTGMLNLNGAMKALNERVANETDENQQLVLVAIGLKNLRQINSVFGHLEGDQALLSLANAINDCIDSNVLAARIGGDEFLVSFFISNLHASTTDALLDVLSSRLNSYNQVSGKNYSIEIAIGKVVAPIPFTLSLEGMLNEAIAQKDQNKSASSNEKHNGARISADDKTAATVAEILNENRLTYHFQPIVHTKTGHIFAYEALMRTDTTQKISALTMLQYAGALGKLYEVEWLTYYNVLRYMRQNGHLLRGHKVFLNSIPGHFLSDGDFQKLSDAYGDLLPNLVVEFTERAETEGTELQQMQSRCQTHGMEIAVDDYGTGYSNITNLLRYSPNYVKIDHSLINNIHNEPKKQHFVTNIIEFAHANGFMALAEGVETREELRAVIRFGVDLVQGNYISEPEPIPPAEINPALAVDMLKIGAAASTHAIRKTFMSTADQKIDIAMLAVEKYTDVFITQPYVELIGSFGVASAVTLKFKDNITSHVVMHDLHLTSPSSAPCIILGRNTKVTLECRGDNRLDNAGICVPETASLHLTGRGNLSISCVDVQSCAIGGDVEMGFGSIDIDLAGCLQITTSGTRAIGIGGGYAKGQDISINGTKIFLLMDGADSVGIGAENGDCNISLAGCSVCMEIRTASGIAVGINNGEPKINMNTVDLDVLGSGKNLAVVGSLSGGADLSLKDCTLAADLRGRAITILGSDDNAPAIAVKRCDIRINCEGSRVMNVGSMAKDADVAVVDTNFDVKIHAATALHFAAAEGHLLHMGGTQHLEIND